MRYSWMAALLLAGCGASSDEEQAKKDFVTSKATWAMALKVDGADVRIPLDVMDVLLWKDEEYSKQNPTAFRVTGEGVSLLGEIPPANDVGYSESWSKLKGATLTLKPSGEFHHDPVESKLTLPGKPEVKVLSGQLYPDTFSGKWSGSEGNKTVTGRIRLFLQDGRMLEGTFSVHGVTWG